MKNFNFILLFFISTKLISQDTIIKRRNNERIICSIIEVNSTITKYSIDSAVLQIANPHILEIRYKNGAIEKPSFEKPNQVYQNPLKDGLQIYNGKYYLNKEKISQSDVHFYLTNETNDKEIHFEANLASKYRKAQYTGFIGLPLGLFTIGYYLSKGYYVQSGLLALPGFSHTLVSKKDKTLSLTLALTAISLPINSSVFKKNSKKHYENAIRLYNKSQQ